MWAVQLDGQCHDFAVVVIVVVVVVVAVVAVVVVVVVLVVVVVRKRRRAFAAYLSSRLLWTGWLVQNETAAMIRTVV